MLHFAWHVLHGGRFFRSLGEHPPLDVAHLLLGFLVNGMLLQPCRHVGGCKLLVTFIARIRYQIGDPVKSAGHLVSRHGKLMLRKLTDVVRLSEHRT